MDIKHIKIKEKNGELAVKIQVKEVHAKSPGNKKQHYTTEDIIALLHQRGCKPGKVLKETAYISNFQGKKATQGTWVFECEGYVKPKSKKQEKKPEPKKEEKKPEPKKEEKKLPSKEEVFKSAFKPNVNKNECNK